MGLIHVLDANVSNKIAAGEVVERPLSIIKELVENSIDAGATAITAEIRNGGIKYIRVTDNGSGMSAEDAKMCFLRHATSKIKDGGDLDAIYTLGFRGEALSSIGAVAKVKLYTKRECDETGVCVTCEGGKILSATDAGAPNGTIMEVSDLFFNTPARLKFLKKPATEGGYISDLFSRYIFSHPEISFKLIRDGKETLFSAGDNKLINAVYAVYGKDYARNMLDVAYEYNGITVSGVIGKGTLCRANRGYETFFVNKRYIKSAIMIRALEEAYKNQIMISKFPTAILNIGIDVRKVDINVHPTKLECKFSNDSDIYQAVYHAVKNALYALPNVPEIEHTEKKKPTEGRPQIEQLYIKQMRDSLKPSNDFKFKTEHRGEPAALPQSGNAPKDGGKPVRDTSRITPAMSAAELHAASADDTAENLFNEFLRRSAEDAETKRNAARGNERKTETGDINSAAGNSGGPNGGRSENAKPWEQNDPFKFLDEAVANSEKISKRKKLILLMDSAGEEDDEEPETPDTAPETADVSGETYDGDTDFSGSDDAFMPGEFRVIGQLFETYILLEKGERLLMIDQHAAHERLNYEELKKELEKEGITSQLIMIPVTARLGGSEYETYRENKDTFVKLGFEISGDDDTNTVTITAAPCDIGWSDIEPLFVELLTQAKDLRRELISETKQRLLYTISCKAAIKANMKLSEKEMRHLAEKVFELKNINTCPHGRPIVISMTKKELEKNFKRIV